MRKLAIGLAGAFLVATVAGPAIATKDADKVFICHRTMSEKNPYVLVLVDEASWQSPGEGVNAHLDHTNHGGDWVLGTGVKGDFVRSDCLEGEH